MGMMGGGATRRGFKHFSKGQVGVVVYFEVKVVRNLHVN